MNHAMKRSMPWSEEDEDSSSDESSSSHSGSDGDKKKGTDEVKANKGQKSKETKPKGILLKHQFEISCLICIQSV